jgi:hypothetical protein
MWKSGRKTSLEKMIRKWWFCILVHMHIKFINFIWIWRGNFACQLLHIRVYIQMVYRCDKSFLKKNDFWFMRKHFWIWFPVYRGALWSGTWCEDGPAIQEAQTGEFIGGELKWCVRVQDREALYQWNKRSRVWLCWPLALSPVRHSRQPLNRQQFSPSTRIYSQ